MKSQKGVTLTSLVLYILLLMMVIGLLTTISDHFYKNTGYVSELGKYVSEYNKFNMFFVEDVKNNTETYSVENNKIIFGDGTMYTFAENSIYRNKVQICKNIYGAIFSQIKELDEANNTKTVVNVKLIINGSKVFSTENSYVLKYW